MKDIGNGKYFIIGGAGDGNDDFGVAAAEMIAASGKEAPVFLFIGFAQLEPHHGFEYYGELFASLGCVCGWLTDADAEDGEKAAAKIAAADVIFIMGGNTGKLMRTLRRYGIDGMLRRAAERGAVMSGFSAGAICLCAYGMSKNEDYVVERGMGCLDLYCCPHPLTSRRRFELFRGDLKNHPELCGAAFDGAALEIREGAFRALVFCPDGYMARICRMENGEYVEREVGEEWQPLDKLWF